MSGSWITSFLAADADFPGDDDDDDDNGGDGCDTDDDDVINDFSPSSSVCILECQKKGRTFGGKSVRVGREGDSDKEIFICTLKKASSVSICVLFYRCNYPCHLLIY